MSFAAGVLERAAHLDAAGFLPERGEAPDAFFARTELIQNAQAAFLTELAEKGELTVFQNVHVRLDCRVPDEIVVEAEEVTDALYAFRAAHVPGFFLTRDVGLLWGGCMISDNDLPLSIFLVRGAFRTRERWFVYGRRELLAHELCHSMRQSLHEATLEEYFAYQTSPSRLRRYLGNCFIHERDAILFVMPTLLLLAAQLAQSFFWERLPVWPFWPVALAYPLFLLFRNAASRRLVKRAAKKLAAWGVERPQAMLFRCTREEMRELTELPDRDAFHAHLALRTDLELRWAVIQQRFVHPNLESES